MVVPRFVQQALEDKPLTVYGDGGQSRCFCDVEDVVRAIWGLAGSEEAVGQVFNIGSTHEVTILDLARQVLDSASTFRRGQATSLGGDTPREFVADDRIVFVPYDQAYEAGFEDMRRRIPDIRKIRDTIGWEPVVPLKETLRRMVSDFAMGEGSS